VTALVGIDINAQPPGGCMRAFAFVLVATIACDKMEEIPTRAVLETTATSYVATEMPTGLFDYGVTVVVKVRNTSEDEVVRISQCTAGTTHPPYWVEKPGTGLAAWDPNIDCAITGTPYKDVLPGAELLDTLELRAPWRRTVIGQPIGDIEGEFYLVYETNVCAELRGTTCYPGGVREYARSNHFTVTKQ
jgi:hypothetical protein